MSQVACLLLDLQNAEGLSDISSRVPRDKMKEGAQTMGPNDEGQGSKH